MMMALKNLKDELYKEEIFSFYSIVLECIVMLKESLQKKTEKSESIREKINSNDDDSVVALLWEIRIKIKILHFFVVL